jgi:hypothetical protein
MRLFAVKNHKRSVLMKKFLVIGLIVAFVLIIVGGAGVVFARVRGLDNSAVVTVNNVQNGDKIIRQFGVGPGGMMQDYGNGYGPGGMMGGYGPGGMMGGYGPGDMMGGYGPGIMGGRGTGIARGAAFMHDYMISSYAFLVGLTVEEVDIRLANGETFKDIAIAQGTTEDQLPALVTQMHKNALDLAVADGVITQAQADLMLERMNAYDGQGFGPGLGLDGCPMWDGDEVQP